MSHNKGKKYRKCPACERKRYCTYKSVNDDYTEGTCSQGHKWVFKTPNTQMISNILKKIMLAKSSSLFKRDDTFYKMIKKRS